MNRIRSIWNEGRAALLGWVHIPSVVSVEMLGHCGYDGIVLDLQHGAADAATALPLMVAIEGAGAEPFVRVQANDPGDIMKLIDFGAYGVIAPMVSTVADAERFAAALHYPPRGSRSFGPRRPLLRYGAGYFAAASDSIVSLAMIETSAALDNLDAILAVDGYDGIFIGPSDLALAVGRAPKADPEDALVLATIAHIIARCKAAGKRVGMFCASAAYARRMIDAGCDIVSLTPDLTMLTQAARETVRETRLAARATAS